MSEQVRTTGVTTTWVMRRAAFVRGVEDVRAGHPPTFDEHADSWAYERGRLFARIAPVSMPIKIGNKLNPKAVALFDAAADRKLII